MEKKKLTLLAIDDNQDNLTSLKALINEAFPEAILATALNGKNGFEIAKTEEPDVILLDIVMPNMDGFEVCRKLKADPIMHDIPVVFLTALKGDKESRIRALECGGEAFLAKPIDETELTAQIRAMVKIKQANLEKRDEKERLAALVEEQTRELKKAYKTTLNLLNDLKKENETRKKSERSLNESEELFKSFVINSSDLTTLTDENDLLMFISPQCENVLGFDGEQYIGQKMPYNIHPDDVQRCHELWKQLKIESGEIKDIEYRIIDHNGITKWLSHTAKVVKVDSHIIGIQSTIKNITERKLAEETLRESEEKYHKLFALFRLMSDTMPDMLWAKDLNQHYIFTNRAFCKNLLNAVDTQEPIGKTDIYFAKRERDSHPDDPNWHTFGEICMDTDTITLKEMKEMQFDEYGNVQGQFIFLDVHKAPLFNDNGELIGVVGSAHDITERKRADEALRESELKYRSLIENTSDVVFCVNENGEYQFTNQVFASTFGKTPDYFIGKTFWDIYPKEEADYRQATNKRVFETGISQSIEVSVPLPDKTLYFIAKANPIKDETGRVILNLTSAIDITDRKLAEETIRTSKILLEQTLEQSPVPMALVSMPDAVIRIANPACLSLLGIEDEPSIIGTPLLELKPSWQDLDLNGQPGKVGELPLARSLKGQKTEGEERCIVRKDGSIRYELVNGFPIIDDTGKIIAGYLIMMDITERKQTEKAIYQTKKEWEDTFDSLTDAITIHDEDYNIIRSNNAAKKLLKLPEIGKQLKLKCYAFYHGTNQPPVGCPSCNCLKSGEPCIFELFEPNLNSYFEIRAIPRLDSNNKVVGLIHIVRDISERKKTEEELIDAKERAEESDRLKSSFLANMSHEIRTPMNSIMGFASLMPEEESRDLMNNYSNIIVRSSEQLLHIIDDIVLYSRLQTRLLTVTSNPFNVQNLLTDVKQSFSLPDFQKGIELNIETDLDVPVWVRSDYEKIRQLFTNLVSNAFKYTCKGSITIGFTCKDDEIEFFVKDTGMGIPPEELEKVFERFYRGTNVNKGVIGGTGLGLSIVKELAELLGGKIWVESEIYKGSAFYFTLPIKNYQ